MITPEEIRNRLAASFASLPGTILGTVKSVDSVERTCTVDNDGIDMPSVRLQCITGSDKGMVLFPKPDSYVLVVRIENTDEYGIALTSEIESFEMTVGQMSVSVEENAITFNGGKVGMVKLDQLINWMQNVYNDLQKLTTLLASSPVAGNGAPLGIAFVPVTVNPEQSVFEDTKIKH